MKEIIKKFLPNKVKEIIAKYIYNKKINNYFNKKNHKNALLSYIITPFYKFTENSLSHTNFYEALICAKILDEFGYNIDIIDYRYSKKINFSKYDLICGFGDVFQKFFESGISKKIKTIYYATGMHVCHQNHATLKRLKDVYNKKGVWLTESARFVEKTWSHQTTLVDAIIALGNEVCADSYRKYYDGKVYELPAPYFQTQNPEKIIHLRKKESKNNYLWFGGSGLIHKGLDLCLDYFSKNQNLTLHVCGPAEIEFMNAYKKELFELPNIKYHGFVDIRSIEFENILSSCSFVIFPSCSEGGCPSVLTAIGNGGLIPIITKETSVRTGYEIWIEGFDYDSIYRAIKYSQELSFDEIKELQHTNLIYVKTNHNQKKYYEILKAYIKEILGQ